MDTTFWHLDVSFECIRVKSILMSCNHLNWIKLIFYSIVLWTVLSNCSDPIVIGTDLLEQDLVEVSFTDTMTLRSKTLAPIRTVSYAPPFDIGFTRETLNQLDSYVFGNFVDPIFGTTQASIYIQPQLSARPDFQGAVVDSLVLVLPFDTLGFFGDTTQELEMEVFRVLEFMESQDYYTDVNFAFDESPLGTGIFKTSAKSVKGVIEPRGNKTFDTITYPAQLRIQLSNRLGGELINLDTSFYVSNTDFVEYFNGLYLRPKGKANSLASFLLRQPDAGMDLYYTQTDPVTLEDTSRVFQFRLFNTAIRAVNIQHDRSEVMVNDYVDSDNTSDSLMFVQGMAGVMGKIEFPFLDALEDAVINKAELEMTLATVPGYDTAIYRPIEQFSVFQTLNDGTIEPAEDLWIVLQGRRPISTTFGGNLSLSENELQTYTVNITAALTSMLRNNTKKELLISGLSSQSRASTIASVPGLFENDIIYSAFSSIERANSSILYGANHPLYPMKLKVTYSRIE